MALMLARQSAHDEALVGREGDEMAASGNALISPPRGRPLKRATHSFTNLIDPAKQQFKIVVSPNHK
jgi:hypothetical protein